MLRDLVLNNRSRRRFYQESRVELNSLRELVDLARLSASAANMQPLKYILSGDPQKNALIFPYLRWAGYLKEWPGPIEGERPSAYIIVLGDTRISQSLVVTTGLLPKVFFWVPSKGVWVAALLAMWIGVDSVRL